jgi:nicotinamidase-related amidase
MVDRLIKKIDAIRVTLDSHHDNDIAHPIFWKDSNGNHPPFFTIISVEDVEKGKWTPTINSARQTGLDYVRALRTNNRYPLCIWPPHCIIGTPGHTIVQPLASSITKWATTRMRYIDYVSKGSNPFTEHYSAVKADVEDPKDETTRLNTDFISALVKSDIVLFGGEALSHCVANSVFDICDNFGEDNIKKIVLLEDCSSSVGGFEQQGKDFISVMTKRGMRISKSTEFLA